MSATLKEEILTLANPQRFVLFPIQYPDLYQRYKKLVASFWTAEEINLSKDAEEFPKLEKGEQDFIKYILAFFAAADGIVMDNLATRFLHMVQIPEARAFYAYQIFNEQVHAETYGRLLEVYVKDEKERKQLFEAIQNMPVIRAKGAWSLRWLDDEKASPAQRYAASTISEGLHFQASFCAIFWLKHVKQVESQFGRVAPQLNGLFESNQLISRDEGEHCDFQMYCYRTYISNPLPQTEMHEMFKGAVEVESQFVREALKTDLVGMNQALMIQYVQFVADQLCQYLRADKIYNVKNPFQFLEQVGMSVRGNIFEIALTEYRRPGVAPTRGSSNNDDPDAFTTDLESAF